MRAVGEVVAHLQQLGVRLWQEEGRLRYQAPRGVLGPKLLDEMREHKAALLALCERAGAVPTAEAIAPRPRDAATRLPISFAQNRLWLHDRAHGADPAYNIALALRLRGGLDVPALQASLQALLQRHEPLRTAFREEGGEVLQHIEAAAVLPWQVADLGAVPPAQRLEQAQHQAAEAALRPFDLRRAPLMRAALWRLADDEHVLLLVVHHIVADGRSVEVLAEELGACYAARRAGRPDDLLPLALQQADVAWHQRAVADDAAQRESLAYWQRRLAGVSAEPALPTDRARTRRPSSAGGLVHHTLDAAATQRLRRAAAEAGATPYAVLVAAVALLAARHSGSQDLVVACPVTHRDRPELQRLVGFFVDTVALRVELPQPQRLSWRELLERVRVTVAEALGHQRAPFELVAEALDLPRLPGQAPLVALSVAMLDARHALPSLPSLQVEPFQLGNPSARYELSVEVHDAGDTLALCWIYATALFDPATVEGMARQLQCLLDAALARPDTPVAALPLLDAAQRQAVLAAAQGPVHADWNLQDEAGFIHRLVQAQASRTPDAVAVTAGARQWRYAELDAESTRLAQALAGLGAGPGARVGVCLERSFELVVALLAVLKAGAGYVPLDPEHAPVRLAAMLRDATPTVLLTHSTLAARLPLDSGVRVLCLDQPLEAPLAALPAPGTLRGHHLAYLLYTSGSTGTPKGVMIPHRAIANHMRWMAQAFPLGAGDAVLQRTPCGFDASVWEFWAPLMAGARLVLAPPGGHTDAQALAQLIRAENVTVVQAVPTLLHLLAEEPAFARCASLRRIFSGGETLAAELARRLAAGGAEVVNLYGPTEATIDATFWRWDGTEAAGSVPIGQPIANLRAYVLDERGEPVPDGVAGELVIGGAGVALGYLNRPGLDAERFVADPFAAEAGARMYRSGDRVRRLPGGGPLVLLGRSDRQVKVRGVRIELDEVEAVLGTHPAVRQCAVALQGTARGPVLVAWVVGEPAPAAAELAAYLRPRLPGAAVPAAFMALPGLPTTTSGKVDRRALAAMEIALPEPAAATTLPRTPTEAALATHWAELLEREHMGVEDDFLDLGGHSLTAMRLVARVRQAFGVEVAPHSLFEGATVASLARVIDAASARARDEAAARLREQIARMDPAELRALLNRKRARLQEAETTVQRNPT